MKMLVVILLYCMTMKAYCQTFTEKTTKEFLFSKVAPNNTVMIMNINGSVDVTGYKGDKIIVEVEKTIKAKTNDALEKAKERISVGYKDLSDTLIFYVDGLCSRFGKSSDHHGKRFNDWGYDWNNCKDEDGWVQDKDSDYTFNFVVKIPETAHVVASTINKGDIDIVNVSGVVVANNINGSITLNHLRNKTDAHTVNGDLDLSYDVNPSDNCRFYTLNGDINADFSPGLAANVSFESFNGALYTNLDEMEMLPVTMEEINTKAGIKYKLKGNKYKIRNGGAALDFETFNGNVYLKEGKQ